MHSYPVVVNLETITFVIIYHFVSSPLNLPLTSPPSSHQSMKKYRVRRISAIGEFTQMHSKAPFISELLGGKYKLIPIPENGHSPNPPWTPFSLSLFTTLLTSVNKHLITTLWTNVCNCTIHDNCGQLLHL